ncbi:hypothetical protein Acr_24g0016080 [Actinidia rufa]|uniref:Uncharacterized protein n=1 Tax=Actinidia rufa TaxID=165716 RepID=A0A7J0GXE5_9ERIC|nr:hypothetical protein Acr_24g0016080 [Actinidia rufa]
MALVFDFEIPTVVVVLLLECAAIPAAISTVTLLSLSLSLMGWDSGGSGCGNRGRRMVEGRAGLVLLNYNPMWRHV